MNVPINSTPSRLPAKCRRIFAGLACGGLLAAGTVAASAATIVDDFNVELPAINLPTTFSSPYTYVSSPFVTGFTVLDSLWDPKKIAIVASSADVHTIWAYTPTVPSLLTGGARFLAVNGSETAGDIVYQKIVSATNGGTYSFQFDFTMLFPTASAQVEMTVEYLDGANLTISGVTSPTVANSGVNTWVTQSLPGGVAPAGTAKARITIANSQTVYVGNDFGIDNVAFTETLPPPPPPPVTCVGTGTLGYWKNHPAAWPVNAIIIGGVTYTKAQAIAAMSTSPAGDKTYTMFQQLVAARLNVLIGNVSTCIDSTIVAADAWLTTYPLGSKPPKAAWSTGGPLATLLDQYNNGLLCATHRDDLNCN